MLVIEREPYLSDMTPVLIYGNNCEWLVDVFQYQGMRSGLPILDTHKARTVPVIKRSMAI